MTKRTWAPLAVQLGSSMGRNAAAASPQRVAPLSADARLAGALPIGRLHGICSTAGCGT